MSTKQQIILRYFREGQSQRKIARALQISRLTVRKYIAAYSQSQNSIKSSQGKIDEQLIEEIVAPPSYDSSNRGKRRLIEELASRIDEFLQENGRKREAGLHKQLMKKIDIYEALQEEGFQIGYTSVCNYIRSKTNKTKEAYIRQVYEPASVCEFDWGEVKLVIAGKRRTYYLAVFTSAYSNYRYAELFHLQDTASFQQSHVNFFAHIRGVYHQMVYDNMRVAIRRFVGLKEKEPTEALLNIATYYNFNFRFCNVARGNEKGHVERSVEYIRRKAFSMQDSFDALSDANEWLIYRCEQLNVANDKINKNFIYEQEHLYQARPAFDCCRMEDARVDKYATVMVSGNRYSVPDHLVGKLLQIKLYAQTVKCYCEKKVVATHQRLFAKHNWSIKIEHYLTTLRRKPGALAGSLALQSADQQVQQIYQQHYLDHAKDFIELLLYMQEKQIPLPKIQQTIDQLQALGCRQITTDKIITLCQQKPYSRQETSTGAIEEESQKQLHKLAQLFANH